MVDQSSKTANDVRSAATSSPARQFECCACGGSRYEAFLDDVPDRLGVTGTTHRYVQCQDCQLVALFPRPSFDETAAFYPRSFWRAGSSQVSSSPAKRAEAWFRERLVLADFSYVRDHFRPGLRHLDVGCATGDFMVLCQSCGVLSKGIELSAVAAEHCRSERGLDVVAGDLVTHDFQAQDFDIITYNGVLEHLPDPRAHLLKCRHLLRAGGKLIVLGLPNIKAAGFRLARRAWIGLDAPRHIHQFSRTTATRLLEAGGFQVLQTIEASPRFNPPSLVASVLPALHRHQFDALEARTGRNPLARKALLLALLQAVRPVDSLLCRVGLSEHMTFIAEPKGS